MTAAPVLLGADLLEGAGQDAQKLRGKGDQPPHGAIQDEDERDQRGRDYGLHAPGPQYDPLARCPLRFGE